MQSKALPGSVVVLASSVGSLIVVFALAVIWVARLSIGYDVYVSALGAPGMPTAAWFQWALVLVSVGGLLIAFSTLGIRGSAAVLGWWRPATSLVLASGFFLFASQVTCTPGCPIPYGATFTWQDFVHTSAAVLAFALACWAMLQFAFLADGRRLARLSLGCCVAVAAIAAAGGLMSLAGLEPELGSRFELVATTIAIGWLVSVGVVTAVPPAPQRGSLRRTASARRLGLATGSGLTRAASESTVRQPTADARGLSAPQ